MKTLTAGIITEIHKLVNDKIDEIKAGKDGEAAGMAKLWQDKIEATSFADINFNKDVYAKMLANRGVPASMSYFTFRNHFIKKVLNPIREAVKEYLIEKDSALKNSDKEQNWINGFLENYVMVASEKRITAADFHNALIEAAEYSNKVITIQ